MGLGIYLGYILTVHFQWQKLILSALVMLGFGLASAHALPLCSQVFSGYSEAPANAQVAATNYKNMISRNLEDLHGIVEDLRTKDPIFAGHLDAFFSSMPGKIVVDGGAGLSLYGVELAMKGAYVHAVNAQNFPSLFQKFQSDSFMTEFLPGFPLSPAEPEGRHLLRAANIATFDVFEYRMDFPILGQVLEKVSKVLQRPYYPKSFAYGMPTVSSRSELQNIRGWIKTLANDYVDLLAQLKNSKHFTYHVKMISEFFDSAKARSIDRYIDINGAFYYSTDKIAFLDELLKTMKPGGQALLVLDNGSNRFRIANRDLSLIECLTQRWPQIFSKGKLSESGMMGESMTQEILLIRAPTGTNLFRISDFLAVASSQNQGEAQIPRTEFAEK